MIVAGVFWSIRKYGVGGGVWVRLQLGPKWCQMYIMVYFQKQVNCNGTTIVSREVMARFKYGKIIMAQIQLTLRDLGLGETAAVWQGGEVKRSAPGACVPREREAVGGCWAGGGVPRPLMP